jgi:hypothetical protein
MPLKRELTNIVTAKNFATDNSESGYDESLEEYRNIREAKNETIINSKLLAEGSGCKIWIDNIYSNVLTSQETVFLTENLDRIYFAMTADIFEHNGSWGDIEDDGNVNILLCDLYEVGTNGYYNMTDLRAVENSNRMDIVFLDISEKNGLKNLRENDGKKFFSIFAHELQHMLSDIACNTAESIKDNNELWLNETMSELAACLYAEDSGIYFDGSYFDYFLRDYGTSGGFFYRNGAGVNKRNYLMSALFGLYLENKFGNAIGRIYSEYKEGIFGKYALQNVVGNAVDVNDFFDGFVLASYFDGVLKEQPEIFSQSISYKEKEYDNLFRLRLENNLLYLRANKNNTTINSGSFKYSDKLYVFDENAAQAGFSVTDYTAGGIYLLEISGSIESIANAKSYDWRKTNGDIVTQNDTELLLILIITKEKEIEGKLTIFDGTIPPNETGNDDKISKQIIISSIMLTIIIVLMPTVLYISKVIQIQKNKRSFDYEKRKD